MPALDLLAKMQATRIHLALIIDEYGGSDGLVSIEDLVELIVGDIADEHDEAETAAVTRQSDGSFVATGRASLEDVRAVIGEEFDVGEAAQEVDTLGGYLVMRAGHVPVREQSEYGTGDLRGRSSRCRSPPGETGEDLSQQRPPHRRVRATCQQQCGRRSRAPRRHARKRASLVRTLHRRREADGSDPHRRVVLRVAALADCLRCRRVFRRGDGPAQFLADPVCDISRTGLADRRCRSRAVARNNRGGVETGWWFGFGYFLAGLYWIGFAFLVDAPTFGWLLPIAVGGLPAGLAIFTAFGVALARLLWTRGPLRILALAIALTASEWLRGHVLTGFPWNAFGYALTSPLVLARR